MVSGAQVTPSPLLCLSAALIVLLSVRQLLYTRSELCNLERAPRLIALCGVSYSVIIITEPLAANP